MSKNRMPEAVAQDVLERSQGVCEVMNFPHCTGQGEHLHHRKISGREHTVENVVNVCSADHRWIHDHPAESYRLGWLVKMNHDPADTPIRYQGRPALLSADGHIHYQPLEG